MGGQGREKGSQNKVPKPPSLKVGDTHGVWTILAYEGSRRPRPADTRKDQFWTCKCSNCGIIVSRTTALLRSKWKGCRCGLVVPDASFNKAFRTYKRQARVRSLSFELTIEEFKNLVQQNCFYCGKGPELNSYSIDSKIRIPMNGIDRKNSDLSYTLENCIPCCGMCNKAKLNYPPDVFLKWVDRVAGFQRNKPISTKEAVCKIGVPKPDEEWELEEIE